MSHLTILGIDPGSRITGYGIIRVEANKNIYVASGCIKILEESVASKLDRIYQDLKEIILTYQPTESAIEDVFMSRNAKSALKLGQARGAAIVACANHSLPVAEYSPRQVKQSVVGYGAASKEQVQQMMMHILNLSGAPQADASDALAIAVCHAHSRGKQAC